MVNSYCHLCKDGGKNCIEVNANQDYAMKVLHPKCQICGRQLVE